MARPRPLIPQTVRMRDVAAGPRESFAISAGQPAADGLPAVPAGQLFSWGCREGGLLGHPANEDPADYPAWLARPVGDLQGVNVHQVMIERS